MNADRKNFCPFIKHKLAVNSPSKTCTAMTVEHYSLILSVASALIMLMLGIVAFFVKGLISSSKAVETAVNSLTISVATDRTRSEDFRASCDRTHDVVTNRLNDHRRRLDDHEKKITTLEVKAQK